MKTKWKTDLIVARNGYIKWSFQGMEITKIPRLCNSSVSNFFLKKHSLINEFLERLAFKWKCADWIGISPPPPMY